MISIDLALDTYYDYNFNHPIGRVTCFEPMHVLSNEFSLNQAAVISASLRRRRRTLLLGGRLDLQIPSRRLIRRRGHPRTNRVPGIYRNIFQAYGSYVALLGKGLDIDFGKWRQFARRRRRLHERSNELLALSLLHAFALLPYGTANQLSH